MANENKILTIDVERFYRLDIFNAFLVRLVGASKLDPFEQRGIIRALTEAEHAQLDDKVIYLLKKSLGSIKQSDVDKELWLKAMTDDPEKTQELINFLQNPTKLPPSVSERIRDAKGSRTWEEIAKASEVPYGWLRKRLMTGFEKRSRKQQGQEYLARLKEYLGVD